MALTFTRRTRGKNAERIAARQLDRLFATAERLSLRGADHWKSDYAIGFLWRHVWFGQQAAKSDFWCGFFGWLIQNYPNDDEQRRLFFKLVPERLDVAEAEVRATFDAAVADAGNGNAFDKGAAAADRILNRVEFGHTTKDDYGDVVTKLERRFRDLPGRHPVARTIGLALPAKLYPYLVAHTLGAEAFDTAPDDVGLARLLSLAA